MPRSRPEGMSRFRLGGTGGRPGGDPRSRPEGMSPFRLGGTGGRPGGDLGRSRPGGPGL